MVPSPNASAGLTNEWTKPTSGYWEEPYWSLGVLPSKQDAIVFANDGYKALAIGPSTSVNYRSSLSIRNLTVDRPNNLLLLNYAGMNVPLSVASDFVLGRDSFLLSYYSSLNASNFYCSGNATFAELSQASFNLLQIGQLAPANAELVISNAFLSSDTLLVGASANGPPGKVNQYDGANQVTGTNGMTVLPSSAYNIRGGTLRMPRLLLYGGSNSFFHGAGNSAQFIISGGLVQVDSLGSESTNFQLQAGQLEAGDMSVIEGTFTQSGGLSTVGSLGVALRGSGHYLLAGGTLLSRGVRAGTFDGFGELNQSGGVHTNSAGITLEGAERTGHHAHNGGYVLTAGFLSVPTLYEMGGFFRQSGGTNLAGDVVLDFSAEYTLNGGSLECSNLNFTAVNNGSLQDYEPCTFLHRNGVITVKNRLIMDPPSYPYFCCFTRGGLYQLDAGRLNSHFVDVGDQFVQSGGLHTNDQTVQVHGRYTLTGGALGSPQVFVDGTGLFTQTGGTNAAERLLMDIWSAYNLNDGTLSTLYTTVSGGDRSKPSTNRASFTQTAGSHAVQNAVTVDGILRLNGGTLSAPNLTINPDGDLWLAGGTFNNSDRFTMYDGVCYAQGEYPNLGKLYVLLGLLSRTTNANVTTLDLLNGRTVLRFKDSHDVSSEWNGRLVIRNWSGSTNGGGADQIFVGTTAQGLTVSQLQRISFLNPEALPLGTYAARILANGEVVPAAGPSIGFSRTSRALVLSWSGNYDLWTTTNLLSPWSLIAGGTSPYTNSFTSPQRYFQLRSR